MLASLALLLTGCGSMAPVMPMPVIPPPQKNLVEAQLEFRATSNLSENAVQLGTHKIRPSSSIVINVPDNLFNQGDGRASAQEFQTKDFFNDAEQQIERVLITNGFRVLSRSKFEAKLRTLRDEARCNLTNYSCLYSQVSEDMRPILDDLTKKFERQQIDGTVYAEELKKFRDKFQTSSTGKKRAEGDKELTDISEVIRAAEAGDVHANYILQINKFETDQRMLIKADLNHNAKIRDFVRNNPEIKSEFDRSHEVSCAAVGASLNAKLVDVKTGEIVWIGNHQLNEFSSGVHKVSFELGSEKYVANARQIEQFVNFQNTEAARKARASLEVAPPPLDYRSKFIAPVISSGRCEKSPSISSEDRSNLVRQVTRELISTIKVDM
ncbi:hypothetical protein [Pseudoduganella sp. OTU4001]|uniref:hypothetical protein n=1 Tax=Pseudoduganella sp. OTU4001 TaxID=3043854 RepID=UPI00313DFD09